MINDVNDLLESGSVIPISFLSRAFNISHGSIQRVIRDGHLTPHHEGNRIYVTFASARKFIADLHNASLAVMIAIRDQAQTSRCLSFDDVRQVVLAHAPTAVSMRRFELRWIMERVDDLTQQTCVAHTPSGFSPPPVLPTALVNGDHALSLITLANAKKHGLTYSTFGNLRDRIRRSYFVDLDDQGGLAMLNRAIKLNNNDVIVLDFGSPLIKQTAELRTCTRNGEKE